MSESTTTIEIDRRERFARSAFEAIGSAIHFMTEIFALIGLVAVVFGYLLWPDVKGYNMRIEKLQQQICPHTYADTTRRAKQPHPAPGLWDDAYFNACAAEAKK